MAEYTSSGIWAVQPTGGFRHGMVSHATLGLPPDLSARFNAWNEAYMQGYLHGALGLEGFNAEGLALAQALKRHVGAATEVVFAAESQSGLLPDQLIDAEQGAADVTMDVNPVWRDDAGLHG
jgi:hypothetical protein